MEPAPRATDRIHSQRTALVVFAVIAVLGGIAAARLLTLLERYSHYDGLLGVFFTALFFSTVLSAVTVGVLYLLDRRDLLPWQMYAGLLVWGAVLSTGLALPINQRVLEWVDDLVERNNWIPYAGENRGFLLGAPIAGPLVEETLKGIGVFLVFLFFRSYFRSPRDGFVMGALIGVGFNWFEAALYVSNDFGQWGVHTYGTQLGNRFALFGFAMHPLFTGLTGLGLGYAAQSSTTARAVGWGILGFLLSLTAHLVNNALGLAVVVILHTLNQPIPDLGGPPAEQAFLTGWIAGSIKSLIIFLPSLILVLVTLRRTGKWELATIKSQLQGESSVIVTEQERQAIERETGWRNRRYTWEPRSSAGKIVRQQNRLAFAKLQAEREGIDPDRDPDVMALRERILALRYSASSQ